MKTRIIALALVSSIFLAGCGQRETVVYQQAPAPVMQPQYVYPPTNDAAIIGAAITGAALTAVLLNGQPRPGYIMVGDRVYRDTPAVRNYSKTVIVNKTVVNNVNNNSSTPVPTVSKPVAGVANPVAPAVKPKNPGDAAADAERAKMKVEADAKAAQQAKQAQLKSDLQAKQAARASAPAKSGGFNSMSKSASSSSKRK